MHNIINIQNAQAAKTIPPLPHQGFRLLPLTQVRIRNNYRQTFDPVKLDELAASIRTRGVLQPVLVRETEPDAFEIIAGGRRFRAAQLADLTEIPARVVALNEDEIVEFQLVENLQREGVHPYEEAQAYRQLLERPGYDVPALAAKVGKSVSYVYQRLALANLIPAAAEAFQDNRLTIGHAVLLARLPQEQQVEALPHAFREDWQTKMQHAVPVRELTQWIRDHLMLDLADAPFDKEDAMLFPEAGTCLTCPKRTGYNRALWDEWQEDRCLDSACYGQKVKFHIARQVEAHSGLVPISANYHSTEAGRLTRDRYTLIEPPKGDQPPTRSDQKTCDHMQEAIIAEGGKLGALVQICSHGQCKIHRAPNNRITPDWQQQRAEQERQRQQEAKQQQDHFKRNKLLFESVLKKVPARLGRVDYQMIVDGFIQALSREDFEALAEHHRIDTEQIQTEEDLTDVLTRRTKEMPEPKLKQMLVELCLLPFGYSYRELPADNPLVAAAQRYGVKLGKEATQKAAATRTTTGKPHQMKRVRAKAGVKGAGA
jgi:ParB family transcriptional regulator, chromosome partitioning protein